uniref:ribonuclease H n=1 Tax=Oreochromis niloticus TaxID=8128 RepID=A0A669CS17_ORENI
MCVATRFPEAIPLRTLKVKSVVKALVNFFSTFGLPKVVQTDQGSNFMSKIFAQVLQSLGVKHQKSSAYHPESQGALERFHQTLKSMMRKFCLESGKEWDEGLPLLLLAVRESVQESLGFSPAELVFGHTVRGPLLLLKENFLSDTDAPKVNVLDYVSSFRERLHKACAIARDALVAAQGKMKRKFDKKAVQRKFEVGDKVLTLLPVPGSSLQAKFSGPYTVQAKLSDTDYVIDTPERRKKCRVCHINMMKPYFAGGVSTVATVGVPGLEARYDPVNDDLVFGWAEGCARLRNSEILSDLRSHLKDLDDDVQDDVCQLIENHLDLFSDTPSCTTVLEHDIDVGGHPPIKQHAYRVNPTKRALFQTEVSYLLENGLAVPSSSAWSSPCLLVPKADKTPRFCTDFRKVNSVTKPDSYPLPRMEDCVDRVGSAKFVTKLDLLKGYWQVPLTSRAAEISAFVTPDHFLQYTVMPFGLRNAPATFQRLMNIVLGSVRKCEVYLDDIVVYSDTWSEHIETLTDVFHRLGRASLTLNLAKCDFGKAMVTYLGKQVGQGQVRPLLAKIQAILDFPAPRTRRELRRFLGMVGYYRGFCRNFAEVVAPLTSLTSVLKPFVWSSVCQSAFLAVKALLCSAPVLAAPDFARPFTLEVDASANGAGAVLLQEDQHGVDHPIGYFSKKIQCPSAKV